MKNNKLGSVAIAISGHPRARFNLAHDVNTTASWGDTQPLQCKLMIPNSKATCSVESLVRLAPMVAPTFGRVKFKTWHSFVGFSDLLPLFPALLAQTPISRGDKTFTPTVLPHIHICYLSALILIGAKLTVYKASSSSGSINQSAELFKVSDLSNPSSDVSGIVTNFITPLYNSSDNIPEFDNYHGATFEIKDFFPSSLPVSTLKIPVANQTALTFFDILPSAIQDFALPTAGDVETVTLEGADVVLPIHYASQTYLVAFRLSNFGKRLRKILLGCGYTIDFRGTELVSAMPLFAYFKAYFDVFGLCLYDSYETTSLAKIMTHLDYTNKMNLMELYDYSANNLPPIWWNFVNDLGNCFVTDEQNFVSAHIASTAVSPSAQSGINTFIDVDGLPHIQDNASQSPGTIATPNAHANIDNVLHGQLDSELLKKLYKWTNRNTIAGRRIRDLLKAQGLGRYVDEIKSNFIGFNETIVQISDVVSTSDTHEPATATSPSHGAVLGEYGGRGLQYDESKSFTYETDEYGYWITLVSVVPECGYCQGIDPTLYALDKFALYNPEFDGLGYEATRKRAVVGSIDWSAPDSVVGSLADTFGFVPRYSSFKIAQNLMNGDFNLRGTRNNYLPYTLDKILQVGERTVVKASSLSTANEDFFYTFRLFDPSSVPTAGNIWRFVARYPWLGLYDRIFAQIGREELNDFRRQQWQNNGQSHFEYIGCDFDNFMIHNILNMQYFAPMLPISESFETLQEGNDGKANASMSKA